MRLRSANHYLLVIGSTDQNNPGCLQAVTDNGHFSYDEVSTAADAIEVAEHRRPSLILLNLNATNGSGLDLCRELSAAESTRDIPILAIAGAPAKQQFMISLAVMPCDTRALDREIHRIIDKVH
jgi:CheY-like chemotaxis protein